ncbi:MAG: nucleotide exchange factor GrpE [Opitutus sp.]|nr:nucleotide exchange factor GrpE [Opitutus sp.]
MPEPETTVPLTKAAAEAPPSVPESPDLTAQLATAKQAAAASYDKFMRAAADLENFRRRTVREKEELRLYAASRVLEDLLPVLDNLALGLAAAKQPGADAPALASGIDLVLAQCKAAFASHGLKEISPAGQPFDANLHEALSAQPSAAVPEGSVVTVVRTGYALNGRLLRPASVVVSSGPAKA